MEPLVEMLIGATTIQNTMEFPQKFLNRVIIRSSNFTSGYIYLKETKTLTQKYISKPLVIVALFIFGLGWAGEDTINLL